MVNEIQVGSYNAMLAKLLSMKERAPSPMLAPEIVPALTIEADRPEWSFLKGERLCMAGSSVQPDAGDFGGVALVNPASSGVLITLERVRFTAPVADTPITIVWILNLGEVLATGVQAPASRGTRDTRALQPSNVPPITGQIRYTSGAELIVFPNEHGVIDVPAQSTYQEDMAIVLHPGTNVVLGGGSSLLFECATADRAFGWGFFWRERVLDPAETL